ncbi:MAG: peptide chain release factor N(5)-glutamine methyltransferase [Acidimicrobiia bacterium]
MSDDAWGITAGLPAHEAQRLASLVTGRSRAQLAIDGGVSPEEAAELGDLVRRRERGEPLQYLEGTVEFGPVTLNVDPRALIPRPETEQLFEAVATRFREPPPRVIVDLGTGCGSLALALRSEFAAAEVFGTDIDVSALQLAAENSAKTGLDVDWRHGDLFAALPSRLRGYVDLLVSNPPYIAENAAATLPVEITGYEPAVALFAGDDGLAVLRRIARGVSEWLSGSGVVVCEIGADHGAAVLELFADRHPEIGVDLSGRDRWVVGRGARAV